jgi:hypothetical protein
MRAPVRRRGAFRLVLLAHDLGAAVGSVLALVTVQAGIGPSAWWLLPATLGPVGMVLRQMARREERMLRTWRIVDAEVLDLHKKIARTKTGDETRYEVEIAFDDDGTRREVRLRLASGQAKGMEPGSRVAVLQHPENPHELRPVPDLLFVEPVPEGGAGTLLRR